MSPRALPLVVTRWTCPHCTFSRSKAATTEAHIDRCWSNPNNRGCRTCDHFQPADTENCDCIPGCTITIQEGCNQGQRLPDQRPIIGCPVWEPVDQS